MRELKPYQKIGVEWLKKSRFRLLADGMGLGKSVQAITAIHELSAKRVLIVCPAGVRSNWLNEFSIWGDGSMNATIAYDIEALRGRPEHVFIVSYDYVARHFAEINTYEWDVLILDEVQMVKSLDAKRAKAIFGKEGVCRHVDYIWALSGTPAPNYINDLWILIFSFGATSLGYDDFVREYCTYYHFDRGYTKRLVVTGHRAEKIEELKAMLDPIMLRRQMEEVLSEIPPISFHSLVVDPGKVDVSADSKFFEYARNNKLQELDAILELERELKESIFNGNEVSGGVIEALKMSAKGIATLHRYSGLQKIKPIADLVNQELTDGAYEKIIIFAVHRDVVEGLRQQLAVWNPVTMYGGTDPKKVQKRVDSFQNDKRTRVFIGNIQSAGTGLTLTAATEVLMAETNYLATEIAQAAKRAHRIGQDKPVRVRICTLSNSIDVRINEIVRRKSEEMSQILD